MSYIPMKPLLENALKNNYAHGAFNINLPQQAEAIIEMHEILRSGVILQVAEAAGTYLSGNPDFMNGSFEDKKCGFEKIATQVISLAANTEIPVVLHLDHGRTFETVKAAIDAGFSSVMIDGSHLPYDENVKITKRVVEYAHRFGVSVEGELGILSGTEDEVHSETSSYTNPITAVDFFKRTGCDTLAISYGTKHGAVKGDNVRIRKEIVIATMENMRHEHIKGSLVSHGSSFVPKYIVNEINALGGKVTGQGIPISQLTEVIPLGVTKINIDTDIRLATTRNIRHWFENHQNLKVLHPIYQLLASKPEQFDYRYYLAPWMDYLLNGETSSPEVEAVIGEIKKAAQEIVATAVVVFNSVGTAKQFKHLSLKEMASYYQGEL